MSDDELLKITARRVHARGILGAGQALSASLTRDDAIGRQNAARAAQTLAAEVKQLREDVTALAEYLLKLQDQQSE